MALEIFCQIDKVPCESNVKGYDKWFKVEAFGLTGSYGYDAENEKGQGPTMLADVQISKAVDKSSATLMECSMYKLKVAKVVIEVVDDKPGGGGRQKHLTYTLENCRITRVSHAPGMHMMETIAVAYRVLKYDDHFTSQKMQYDLGSPDAKKAL